MDSDDEEYENEEDIPELLKIRMESVKLWEEFFQQELQNPEMKGILQDINTYEKELKESKKPLPKKGSSRYNDPSCHFAVKIPIERRRSARLCNIPAQEYDEGELERLEKPTHDGEFSNLEKQIYRPRRSMPRAAVAVPILPVEEVTPAILTKIARKGTVKKYSEDGTSCHQCRQKTVDTKSVCRSGRCTGVRGAFCGVCLPNRYGEDVAVVLKDPNWACPPCRGICNCSICRTRNGKMPTGIMAPIAQARGHKSVKDFLITLSESDIKRKAVKKEVSSESDENNDVNEEKENSTIDLQASQKKAKKTPSPKKAKKTSMEPSPKKAKKKSIIKISGIIKKKKLNKHNMKDILQPIGLYGIHDLLLGFNEELNPIFTDADEDEDLLGFADEKPCYMEDVQTREYNFELIDQLEKKLVENLKKTAEKFNFIFNATALSVKNKKLLNII